MSAALATTNTQHIQAHVEPTPQRFTSEQRQLMRDTYCRGATEHEFLALVAVAEARGFNPLEGECYFIQRYDYEKQAQVWSVQASIDGFRIKAEETGLYAGQDEPEFEYDAQGRVKLARVRVYRRDWERPSVGVARFDEYVQTKKDGSPTRMWLRMPHNQLAKCAESLALRKAFPKRFARIYTTDEMGQADSEALPAPPRAAQLPPHDPETGEVSETPRKSPDQRASELASAIEACAEAMGLDVVGRAVARAAKHAEITLDQSADLRERGARKRKELAAAAKSAAEDAARARAGAELEAMGDLAPGWGGDAKPPSTPPQATPALTHRADQHRRALEATDDADSFMELWGLVQGDAKAGKITREDYDALTLVGSATERRIGVGGPR